MHTKICCTEVYYCFQYSFRSETVLSQKLAIGIPFRSTKVTPGYFKSHPASNRYSKLTFEFSLNVFTEFAEVRD